MRKICIIVLVLCTLVFYLSHSKAAEKIDIKIDDQIAIVFLNKSMILAIDEKETTLLVFGKGETDNLDKFYLDNFNVLMLEDGMTDVETGEHMILKGEREIGELTYSKRKGLIYVSYEDTNVCIYLGGEYDIRSCQFIYFYNSDVSRMTLYDYNEEVLYYYKNPLPSDVLEHMYENSVGTNSIRDDELTIIKVNEAEYDIVVIDNE